MELRENLDIVVIAIKELLEVKAKELIQKIIQMPNKIKSAYKNAICQCGGKIIHHHYYCDMCWQIEKESNKLKNRRKK